MQEMPELPGGVEQQLIPVFLPGKLRTEIYVSEPDTPETEQYWHNTVLISRT